VLSVPLLFKDYRKFQRGNQNPQIEEERTTNKIPKGQSESLNRRGTDHTEYTKGAIRILK
jgi:hypothetical protein